MENTEDHFEVCPSCGESYDLRDLGAALYHGFGGCETDIPKVDVPYTKSKRVGDGVEWTKDKKPIHLN